MRTFSHHEDRSYADFMRIQEEVRMSICELCSSGSIIEFEREIGGKTGDIPLQLIRSD
ncbi:MAG: hypothetical protein V7750_11155 [Sneathiella sp.]